MMFSEFYKPGATMDYPLGGAKSLVEVLVKALEERGGKVRCGARVKRLVRVNDVLGLGKVVGVELVNSSGADGTRQVIKARRGVVSNAGTWGTQKLLEASESDWKCRPAKEKGGDPVFALVISFLPTFLRDFVVSFSWVGIRRFRGVPTSLTTP